jgi:hypothetical protein
VAVIIGFGVKVMDGQTNGCMSQRQRHVGEPYDFRFKIADRGFGIADCSLMIPIYLSLQQINNLKSAITIVIPITITMPAAIILVIIFGLQLYRLFLDK